MERYIKSKRKEYHLFILHTIKTDIIFPFFEKIIIFLLASIMYSFEGKPNNKQIHTLIHKTVYGCRGFLSFISCQSFLFNEETV